MAILRMSSTKLPQSGKELAASVIIGYDTDKIVWPTLASKTGTTASSVFDYVGPNSEVWNAAVKHSVTNILSAAGASTVS